MKRIAIIIAIANIWSFAARADDIPRPPSPTLERSIKLYDRKDFYSASIELAKVIDGSTGDDAGNRQRAEFFQAKTYYQMGYYTASLWAFDVIVKAGASHRYHDASLKWLAALSRILGTADIAGYVGTYDASSLADPSLDSVKYELAYLYALHQLRAGKHDEAIKLLETIPRSESPAFYARARVTLGYAHVYRGDEAKALDAWASVPAGEDGDAAALAIGEAQLRAKAWDKAIAAFAKVDRKRPLGARAAWLSSWAALRKRDASYDNAIDRVVWARSLAYDGFEPHAAMLVATAHVCSGAAKADDVLAKLRAKPAAISDELAKLDSAVEDNSDYFETVAVKIRRGSSMLSADAQAVASAVFGGPAMSAAFARIDELDAELALLNKADRAWMTTRVASDILQETTIQRAVAAAEAGKIARERIRRAVEELREIARAIPAAKLPLAVTCAQGTSTTRP